MGLVSVTFGQNTAGLICVWNFTGRAHANFAQVIEIIEQSTHIINPRRACAARVTVVVLCVCVCVCVCECFQGPHLQLTQLSDKVGILTVSVSCSLVFKKAFFV